MICPSVAVSAVSDIVGIKTSVPWQSGTHNVTMPLHRSGGLNCRILCMAKIVRIEGWMLDLKPKVKRTDAIQSFISQETPMIRITDSDGASGLGYSYTIGTGGHSVMALLEKTLGPALIGRDASEIERIWRDLLFLTHATSVGAITSLALAAIDTALWDLKAMRAKLAPPHPRRRRAGERADVHNGRRLAASAA
jgi:hypothetical protein